MVIRQRTAVAVAAIAGFFAPQARAHAFLDHANPAVGSSVPTAPAAVTMWFSQDLEPAFSTASVTDQSGRTVASGAAQVDPKDPTEMSVPLTSLAPGTYTVAWHVLSVDTHTTDGHFSFTVGGR